MTEKFDPQRLGRMYATDEVVEQRRRTRAALRLAPGDTFLDVGSGPGYLTCEVAEDVGPDGRCVGVDVSARMLEAGAALARSRGVDERVHFADGDATDLPLDDASFDAAAVVQVLEYVPDIPAALAELRRVLRPGGRLAIVDTDWRSCVWHTDDHERTETVLRLWEAHFVHPHLPARLPVELREAGFDLHESAVVPILHVGSMEGTYSAGMLDLISAFVAREHAALADAWAADVREQSARGEYFFSLCRFQFAASVRG